MGFTSLPTEVQTQIISYLAWDDHCWCSQVCRSWEAIVTAIPPQQSAWYRRHPDREVNAAIHAVFTVPDVEFIYDRTGFRVSVPLRPPETKIDTNDLNAESMTETKRVLIDSKSRLFDAPAFIPSFSSIAPNQNDLDCWISFAACGMRQLCPLQWEDLGDIATDGRYIMASLRSVFNYAGILIEPDFGLDPGLTYTISFLPVNDVLPWVLGMQVVKISEKLPLDPQIPSKT